MSEPMFAPVADALGDGWLSTAKALDATDLRKAGRRLLEVIDPDGAERRQEKAADREARSAHLNRRLSIVADGIGGAVIRGRCTDETAALIKAVLLPLSRPRPTTVPDCVPASCDVPGCSHDGRDPRDHGARTMDALEEALRLLQGTETLPESHGERPRVNVTVSYDDLRAQTGFATTDTGEDLPPEGVRRLACDADIVPIVLGGRGEVLDVGRQMRLASVAIWRALVVRDQHCRFPGCSRPPVMCHAHHVIHWIDGGPTSLDNLVLLCGHHHRVVHAEPWTITRSWSGDWCFDPPDAVRRRSALRPDRAPPRC